MDGHGFRTLQPRDSHIQGWFPRHSLSDGGSKSTPRNFPLALSPKISRPTELETRLLPALCLLIIPQPPHKQMPKIGELDFGVAPVWWTTVIQQLSVHGLGLGVVGGSGRCRQRTLRLRPADRHYRLTPSKSCLPPSCSPE